MKHYRYKTKDVLLVIKYTGDNRQFLIDNTNGMVYEPPIESKNTDRLWITNLDIGGDTLYKGQYLVVDTDYEGHSMEAEVLESKYVPTGEKNGIYEKWEEKEYTEVEAIQWTGDNTEKVIDFLNHKGGLDQSGETIIIMNFSGGSVALVGDYIIYTGRDYFSMTEKNFKTAFIPLDN